MLAHQCQMYFRVDMNETIATGHMMRCLSIADAARAMGISSAFIIADDSAVSLLQSRNYPYIVLHSLWNKMDDELGKMIVLIHKHNIEKLIIDSYYVTKLYLEALTNETETWYIDDINAFHYPVNGIICYANYWRKFKYNESYTGTELLLGTEYVPLRREFTSLPSKKINKKIEHILILSGGSDEYNIIGKLLESLKGKSYTVIDAICGRFNPRYDEMTAEFHDNLKIHIHRSLPDINLYMKTADLAISAGGTTLYELCACGTPTISYSLADNQLDNVWQFDTDGVIKYAGDVRTDDVATKVIELIKQYDIDEVRKQFSVKMQKIVDGNGAKRIVERIMN